MAGIPRAWATMRALPALVRTCRGIAAAVLHIAEKYGRSAVCSGNDARTARIGSYVQRHYGSCPKDACLIWQKYQREGIRCSEARTGTHAQNHF